MSYPALLLDWIVAGITLGMLAVLLVTGLVLITLALVILFTKPTDWEKT